MFALSAGTLLFNGLTLALGLCFLLILLWHDSQKRIIQFFSAFLVMVILWNVGSLLVQATLLMSGLDARYGIGFMEVGFSGASIALYTLTTVLVGAHSRLFRVLAFASLLLVVVYRVFLIVNNPQPIQLDTYRFQSLPIIAYFLFDVVALYFAWQYRRKIRNRWIFFGILIFVVGQGIAFLNPEIPIVALSTNVSNCGVLLICLGIVNQEIITPLAERKAQVEAVHSVSLAITSQLALETVLNAIATQAASWLEADAVGIFLKTGDELELVNLHHLPPQLLQHRIKLGEGVAGTVAQTQTSMHLENYSRDWQQTADLPYARETFGSVACVPLIYAQKVLGAVMVIAGKQGRLFNGDDVYQLEQLAAQAAVAIAHSRLFEDVEKGRNQLETLLTSTQNPVLAVDRQLRLIFANPAAARIFKVDSAPKNDPIHHFLPKTAFPADLKHVLRAIRHDGTYAYEILLADKVYLCYLATIGHDRINGWVGVMHDITQLKELDRLKSEMVRMVSHDLKNPLMGAMLHLDLISDVADKPEIIESIQVIERQLERMNRIIRGVLDLEQIRNGLKTREICNAYQVLRRSVGELRRMASDKQITLELIADEADYDVAFMGDVEQMERALINLIENALKFTPQDGSVWVSLSHDSEMIQIKIKDTGVGIAPEIHQQIFERFFRGQQKGVEHITGSGLGLSIVKTIVENHGGKIWVDSASESGAQFTVSLPIATSN